MLNVSVTNETDRLVGRANHGFAPGENDPVEVPASRLCEITECAYLTAVVVGADDPMEVPPDVEVVYNATDAAVELAHKHGVNPFAVEGTGQNGQVTVGDVEAHVKEGSAREAITPVVGQASTLDPPEVQREAERQAMGTVGGHETPDDLDDIEGSEHPEGSAEGEGDIEEGVTVP